MSSEKLTAKQRLFIHYYLENFNATQAALKAGYSRRTSQVIGSENLQKPLVAAAIKQGIEERLMSPEETMLRLADIARGDMKDLMEITPAGFQIELLQKTADGERKPKTNTKLIRKIKQKVTTFLSKSEDGEDREVIETELELYSAQDALNSIAKHHKLFSDAAIEVKVEAGESLITAIEKIYGKPEPEDDHASD